MKDFTPVCKPCPTCGTKSTYDEKRDSYACLTCNVWLEANCGDPSCSFCRGRPSDPIPNPHITPSPQDEDEHEQG